MQTQERIKWSTTVTAALQGILSTGHMVANLTGDVLNKEK
jgi:hypothetical protein